MKTNKALNVAMGKAVTVKALTKHGFNPYRDARGRFAPGPRKGASQAERHKAIQEHEHKWSKATKATLAKPAVSAFMKARKAAEEKAKLKVEVTKVKATEEKAKVSQAVEHFTRMRQKASGAAQERRKGAEAAKAKKAEEAATATKLNAEVKKVVGSKKAEREAEVDKRNPEKKGPVVNPNKTNDELNNFRAEHPEAKVSTIKIEGALKEKIESTLAYWKKSGTDDYEKAVRISKLDEIPPPIVTYYLSGKVGVPDGFHRIAAYHMLGKTEIQGYKVDSKGNPIGESKGEPVELKAKSKNIEKKIKSEGFHEIPNITEEAGKRIRSVARKDWASWKLELSKEEAHSLTEYKTGSDGINQYARHSIVSKGHSKKALLGHISNLDAAISRSSVPRDTTVYRGIKDIKHLGLDKKDAIGSVIHDRAFLSTSLDPEVANAFAITGSSAHGVFRISVKSGHKAAYVDYFGDSSTSHESELLFGRGSKIKITGINVVSRENPVSGTIRKYLIDAEML